MQETAIRAYKDENWAPLLLANDNEITIVLKTKFSCNPETQKPEAEGSQACSEAGLHGERHKFVQYRSL